MASGKNAVYPISADPIHNGHLHNIRRVYESGLFDRIYVAIGNNAGKRYLFSLEERVALADKVIYSEGFEKEKVVVEPFLGLLRNYARRKGAEIIVRGVRNFSDLEYEEVIADFNGEYGLTTFILPASKEYRNVSSTLVKSIASEGGLVDDYVHPAVKQALEQRLGGRYLVGVTGSMGVGKSYFCKKLSELSRRGKMKVNHLDFDRMVQSLYLEQSDLGDEVREKIEERFGEGLFGEGGLDRKRLAGIIFGDEHKRLELYEILRVPAKIKLEEQLKSMKGIVLVDAAYLAEYRMLPIVNYNMILLGCGEDERIKRIVARDGMTQEEINARSNAQHPYDMKRKEIIEGQKGFGHGTLIEVDTSKRVDYRKILKELEKQAGGLF